MAQLLIVGVMLLLTAPCTLPSAIAAGLLCGLIAGNRPPDAILAAALGAYGLFWAGRRAALFGVAASVPVLLVLLYNVTVVGALGGGYAVVGRVTVLRGTTCARASPDCCSARRADCSCSLRSSCSSLLAWRHLPRDRAERGLTLAMSAGVVVQVLLYSKVDWRGGISWGPRFLTDLLPLLIWMLVPVVAALGRRGRACFVTAVASRSRSKRSAPSPIPA